MSFNPNIPQPNGFLADSQGQIKNNFTFSNGVMEINHYPFNDTTANKGKHKWSEYVNQTGLPLTQAAGEGTLYTKSVSSESQLFYSPDATTRQYQISRFIEASFALFATNTNYPQVPAVPTQFGGFTWLPGGLLLQYGRADNPGGSGTVKFPVSFTSDVFLVQLTPRNDGSHSAFTYYIDGAPAITSFSYRGSTTGSNALFWLAIGV